MTIDYTRRGPKRPTATPEPVPEPEPPPEPVAEPEPAGRVTRRAGERRRTEPRPEPPPRPDPPELPRGSLAGFALRMLLIGLGYGMTTMGAPLAGWVLIGLTVLSYWRARQPFRYLAAWAGLALLRAYVVKRTEPIADQIGELGAVRDPNALWMRGVLHRCDGCGS